MKSKTPSEWVEWYKEHSGEDNVEIRPDEHIDYHPEHGFICYYIDHDKGILHNHYTCGDGKYWARIYKTIMEIHGLKKLIVYTHIDTKAWTRKYGGHIKGYIMEVDIDEIKV